MFCNLIFRNGICLFSGTFKAYPDGIHFFEFIVVRFLKFGIELCGYQPCTVEHTPGFQMIARVKVLLGFHINDNFHRIITIRNPCVKTDIKENIAFSRNLILVSHTCDGGKTGHPRMYQNSADLRFILNTAHNLWKRQFFEFGDCFLKNPGKYLFICQNTFRISIKSCFFICIVQCF